MRQPTYIFRKKFRDHTTLRALLLGFAGFLIMAPPAVAVPAHWVALGLRFF